MALYYDAASILSLQPLFEGSLRSSIYHNTDLKSPPGLVYRLISECINWDVILSETIDNAGILFQEPKAGLYLCDLVHDLLLSKRGISCPQSHPLRLTVERHKARLSSEFTKARIRRKCATIDALREHVLVEKRLNAEGNVGRIQPRWVRINRLRSTVEAELNRTFSSLQECSTLDQLMNDSQAEGGVLYDQSVPDLLATNISSKKLTNLDAYKSGRIILQDKASCFPAHLLLNSLPTTHGANDQATYGDILDACAAPGNKTTHLVSILASRGDISLNTLDRKRVVYACERDGKRSQTLKSMLDRAGVPISSGNTTSVSAGNSVVKVLANQDFLSLKPTDNRFRNLTHILLDPSCSGSGIIGRQDIPTFALPKDPRGNRTEASKNRAKSHIPTSQDISGTLDKTDKKRKRKAHVCPAKKPDDSQLPVNPQTTTTTTNDNNITDPNKRETTRLHTLSSIQLTLLLHAFTFPATNLITYSTCSTSAIENERVALHALTSPIARQGGWRILRRDEQPEGLKRWRTRGSEARVVLNQQQQGEEEEEEEEEEKAEGGQDRRRRRRRARDIDDDEFRQACIRCEPNENSAGGGSGGGGTIGFFVVGFVRDRSSVIPLESEREPLSVELGDREEEEEEEEEEERDDDDDDGQEWQGFS